MSIDMNNYAQAHAQIQYALRKADNVIATGDLCGVDRPQDYALALSMIAAISAADQAAAPPTPPNTPQQVAKYLTAAADTRAREASRREVTAELLLAWQRTAAHAGLSAIPAIVAAIVTRFDELLATFDGLTDAPRTLTGHESPEQLEQHTELLRCCNDLTVAAMHRVQLANASGEGGDVGSDTLWLLVSPSADSSRDTLNAAILDYQSRTPMTVGEWDAVRPFGLKLANVGEVGRRREAWSEFIWWIGHNTPDLGQRDHVLGEYINTGPDTGPRHSRKVTVHNDEMFV